MTTPGTARQTRAKAKQRRRNMPPELLWLEDLPDEQLRDRLLEAWRKDQRTKVLRNLLAGEAPYKTGDDALLALAAAMRGYGRDPSLSGAIGDRFGHEDFLGAAPYWPPGEGDQATKAFLTEIWERAERGEKPEPAQDNGSAKEEGGPNVEQPLRVDDLPPWEPPQLTGPPPVGSAAYYGPLGRIIERLKPLTEADPTGILICLLVMMGNWLGREFQIAVGADRHSPTLYALLVGPTAIGRKGTAAGLARMCMRALAPAWDERNVLRSLNSGEGIALAVKRIDDASRENGNPLANDKRALFLIGEFGDLLARSNRAGSTILDTLRDAWDGGELDNTSVKNPLRLRDAAVSLLGMITPEELRERLPLRELATGTMNRFMMCSVQRSRAMIGHPPLIEESTIRPLVNELAANVRRARALLKHEAPIKLLRLTSEAERDLAMIRTACEPRGGSWVEAGSARSYVLMLRCAVVYAVADGAAAIERPHVAAAWAMVEHSKNSLASIATEALSDVIARRILEHMRADPGEAPSRKELRRDVFANHIGAREFDEALALLESLGLIGAQTMPTMGRPRTIYRIIG